MVLKLKDLFDAENISREEAKRLGGEVALRLLTPTMREDFGDDTMLQGVIERFQTDCLSQADFNDILEDMYDWADSRLVWVE